MGCHTLPHVNWLDHPTTLTDSNRLPFCQPSNMTLHAHVSLNSSFLSNFRRHSTLGQLSSLESMPIWDFSGLILLLPPCSSTLEEILKVADSKPPSNVSAKEEDKSLGVGLSTYLEENSSPKDRRTAFFKTLSMPRRDEPASYASKEAPRRCHHVQENEKSWFQDFKEG
eukprot:scaffold1_cov375-Pavlova_lutheri.AAC.8